MPRPFKCRRVAFLPGVNYFKPAGIPLRFLEEIILTIEEGEALRLKELEELDQAHGAQKMNISRPTFQRVLASARKKTADALLNGKAIRITGGNYETAFQGQQTVCKNCLDSKNIKCKCEDGTKHMKIAIVTDDGMTICQHFGRARFYTVVTIEEGKVVKKEQRPKAGHHAAGMNHESHDTQGERHGFDAGAQASHAGMMANILDCQIVIAGGMGWGAQVSLKQAGIAVHMTDVQNIDEALALYLENKLPNLQERLH